MLIVTYFSTFHALPGSDSVNDEEYSCDVVSSLLAGKLFFTLKYLLSLEGVYLIDAISFDTII